MNSSLAVQKGTAHAYAQESDFEKIAFKVFIGCYIHICLSILLQIYKWMENIPK